MSQEITSTAWEGNISFKKLLQESKVYISSHPEFVQTWCNLCFLYHNKGEEEKLCLDDEVFWNIVGSREKLLLSFWQEGQKYMLFNFLV